MPFLRNSLKFDTRLSYKYDIPTEFKSFQTASRNYFKNETAILDAEISGKDEKNTYSLFAVFITVAGIFPN